MLKTQTAEYRRMAGLRNRLKWLNLGRSAAVAAIALCFGGSVAQAQTDKEPWQATLTKTQHQVGAPKIYMELPLPQVGRILTLERIGITVGPTASIYGKVFHCEIESERPRIDAAEFLENRTRVLLPLPGHLGVGSKTWVIIHAPIRIYAENAGPMTRNLLRVSCDVDAIAANDAMTVTAVGYTTLK